MSISLPITSCEYFWHIPEIRPPHATTRAPALPQVCSGTVQHSIDRRPNLARGNTSGTPPGLRPSALPPCRVLTSVARGRGGAPDAAGRRGVATNPGDAVASPGRAWSLLLVRAFIPCPALWMQRWMLCPIPNSLMRLQAYKLLFFSGIARYMQCHPMVLLHKTVPSYFYYTTFP
jgi:hypothetical protein